MILFPSKTIEAITNFLFIGQEKKEISNIQLVLVLGNNMIEETVKAIYTLYSEKRICHNAKIILSGATGALNAGEDLECNKMFDCAVKKYSMPVDLFIKEPNAKNACQNFEYSKDIIERLGGFSRFEKILCIGNAFLLRRASMYASKFLYPLEKMYYFGVVDVSRRNIGKNTWWKTEESINRVMAEIERIGKYYQSGDLSIF